MREGIQILYGPDDKRGREESEESEKRPHKSLFSVSLEEEQKLAEAKNTEKLVEAHMRAASNLVYKNFSGVARRYGISMADLQAEAFATIAKCAQLYVEKESMDVSFYAYYKNAVTGRCQGFVQQNKGILPLTPAGKNVANKINQFMQEQGRDLLKDVTEEEIPLLAKLFGTRPDTLRAIMARQASSEQSLDETIGEGEITRHDVISDALLHDSTSPYRTDPETLMIRAEEADERYEKIRARNEFGEHLDKWLDHLPEESTQVIRNRYIYVSRLNRPWRGLAPYERFCRYDDDGNQLKGYQEGGLGLTPAEAAAHEAIGVGILREFAEGDFSRARYFKVVQNLPKGTLERNIMLNISDPLEKRIAEYTFLKTREIKSNEGYKPSVVAMLSPGGLATRNLKALEERAGRILTKEQARGIVQAVIESVSRRIAEHEKLLLEQQKTSE